MKKRLAASVAVLLLLFSIASVAFAAKTYRAEHFDADWTVDQDGNLTIAENVEFVFSGGPFTYVYRELPDDYSDGIEVLSVSMDGQELSAGTGPGQYEIQSGGQKVTWHFAPATDAVHSFQLTYRALGAVRRQGGQDLLVWNFLPTDYEYPINSAVLRVAYPAAAQLVGPPEVRRGDAAVSEGDGQAVFTASNISENSPLTVALRFVEGSLIAEPPAWQQHAAQVADRAPTMWLFSALVLAVGTVFLTALWRSGRRDGSMPEPRAMARTTPPSNLPPALAGALVNASGKAGMVQAVATLFSLAQRGVVTFEQTRDKKWYREAEFAVRLQQAALDERRLDPHEEALIAGLFTDKGDVEVTLTQLGRRLGKTMSPFGKAVQAGLFEQGLLDKARSAYARRLIVTGVGLLILIVPALAVAALVWGTYGGWILLIPGALLVLSMSAFVMGGSYSARSEAGEEAAAAWRAFRDYIKGVTKGREPAWDLRLFDRYFPYAATFDLAQGWAKAFQERGGSEVPAWFRSLSADGNSMASFIVLTSASHSTTTSSGGAGGGGAGGGGGSGAG